MSEAQPDTIRGVLEQQAEAIGDKTFMYFEDRVIRFAELNRLVNRAANGLIAVGAKNGVGVSIMMPNTPEWFIVYCATQKIGAYMVPVNIALKGEGLRHIIDHSDSSILITHPDYAETVEAVRGELSKLRDHRGRRHRAGAGLLAARGLAAPLGADGRVGSRSQRRDRPRVALRPHVHVGHHRRAQGRGLPLQIGARRSRAPARRLHAGGRRPLYLPAPLPRQRALPLVGARAGARRAPGALAPLLGQPVLGRDPSLRRHQLQWARRDDPDPDEAAGAGERRRQQGAHRIQCRLSRLGVGGIRAALRRAHHRGLRGGGRGRLHGAQRGELPEGLLWQALDTDPHRRR